MSAERQEYPTVSSENLLRVLNPERDYSGMTGRWEPNRGGEMLAEILMLADAYELPGYGKELA